MKDEGNLIFILRLFCLYDEPYICYSRLGNPGWREILPPKVYWSMHICCIHVLLCLVANFLIFFTGLAEPSSCPIASTQPSHVCNLLDNELNKLLTVHICISTFLNRSLKTRYMRVNFLQVALESLVKDSRLYYMRWLLGEEVPYEKLRL